MANIYDPTPETIKARDQWAEMLPPHVRTVAARFLPWVAYRIKSTGMAVHLVGILNSGLLALEEDIGIDKEGEMLLGVDPNDMEEADMPTWATPEERQRLMELAHAMAMAQLTSGKVALQAVVTFGKQESTVTDE